MTRSPATAVRPATVSIAVLLAALTWIPSASVAQIYRIETILGDYDPMAVEPLAVARVSYPSSLATDSRGNVYFVDRDTYRVRKVDALRPGEHRRRDPDCWGSVATAVPQRARNSENGSKDLRSTRSAMSTLPIPANYRIRRVNPSGTIETIAGTGTFGGGGDGGPAAMATLGPVYGLATDAAGNLYIADTFNDKVRKISPDGVISRFAGTGEEGDGGDGGPAGHARLDKPRGLAVDESRSRLYRGHGQPPYTPRRSERHHIATIAGDGHSGYGGDGGAATRRNVRRTPMTLPPTPREASMSPTPGIGSSGESIRLGSSRRSRGVGPDAQIEDDGADAAVPHLVRPGRRDRCGGRPCTSPTRSETPFCD